MSDGTEFTETGVTVVVVLVDICPNDVGSRIVCPPPIEVALYIMFELPCMFLPDKEFAKEGPIIRML